MDELKLYIHGALVKAVRGNKQSGIGRENSLAAIEHYTQVKSVYVEGGNVAAPY
jgi:acyl-CoA reductase-like NAD-dependent aldehyde dehydrogenase